MSESSAARATAAVASGERPAGTAGGLLRQAREQQGMPVETLASALKVVPKKIEALEADRYDVLADATFVRALAKAMAHFLKIEPAPVLALLPPLSGPRRLEEVAEGLNMPFRERPDRLMPREWSRVATPAFWLALLILLATLGLYLFPTHWRPWADALSPGGRTGGTTASLSTTLPPDGAAPVAVAPDEAEAVPPASAAGSLAAVEPAAVASAGAVATAAAPASAASGVLRFRASAPSWVEVVDAEHRTLLFRSLQADEEVGLDGTAPFKVKIGNALATRMTVRGEPFDLARATRDNVARLEVK